MQKEGKSSNEFGLASVILGVIGSALSLFAFPIIISLVGLIFGIVQYKKAKNAWAIWGIILSTVGIILSAYTIWAVVSAITNVTDMISACQANPSLEGCDAILASLGA